MFLSSFGWWVLFTCVRTALLFAKTSTAHIQALRTLVKTSTAHIQAARTLVKISTAHIQAVRSLVPVCERYLFLLMFVMPVCERYLFLLMFVMPVCERYLFLLMLLLPVCAWSSIYVLIILWVMGSLYLCSYSLALCFWIALKIDYLCRQYWFKSRSFSFPVFIEFKWYLDSNYYYYFQIRQNHLSVVMVRLLSSDGKDVSRVLFIYQFKRMYVFNIFRKFVS
jgi:hypothetical protein